MDLLQASLILSILSSTVYAFSNASTIGRWPVSVDVAEHPEPDWPIKRGYVAFGDSYAAGMGTGTTSDWTCRIGSSNYPGLLNQFIDDPKVKFLPKMCSGAVLQEVEAQVDDWSRQGAHEFDMATVSVGGNDLDFSNLVKYCIIAMDGQYYFRGRKDSDLEHCKPLKSQALAQLHDDGHEGFPARLTRLYEKIIGSASQGEFHLYVTSYPAFFNHDNPDCDKTTLYYWSPSYDPKLSDGDPRILLTTELRRELNNLLEALNQVIERAVSEVNKLLGFERVHFVNVNPRFNNHRWCEYGPDHEPNENRVDTWFFLSAWRDYDLDGKPMSISAQDRLESKEFAQRSSLALPDPHKCSEKVSANRDPWDGWLCTFAKAIDIEPNGVVANAYRKAQGAAAFGNFHSEAISWLLPTRQIKTFHPRTRGMYAYRDALIESIRLHQRRRACDPRPPKIDADDLPIRGDYSKWAMNGDPFFLDLDFGSGPAQHFVGSQSFPTGIGLSFSGNSTSSSSVARSDKNGQIIAIASYIFPDRDSGKPLWNRMIGYNKDKVGILVANVLNGPNNEYKQEWGEVLADAAQRKKRVLGYVRTGYLGLSPSDPGPFEPFVTRLGSVEIADWIAQIQQDVTMWYSIYGKDKIGGIFFDEGYNECTRGEYDAAKLYAFLSEWTERLWLGAMTVLNPGTAVPSCYEQSADVLLTFESNYTAYSSGKYNKTDWKPKDPRKIWHIIYDVPKDKIKETVALSKANGAGYVQVTNALMPNPYKTLPDEAYMQDFVDAVGGSEPSVSLAAKLQGTHSNVGKPTLRIEGQDFTSVSLAWNYEGPVPYGLMLYSSLSTSPIASIPGSFTRVTIGGLPSGKLIGFAAIPQYHDGSFGPQSDSQASTQTTPLTGSPVSEVKISSNDTHTVYEAQIVVPSGFVRIFLTSPQGEKDTMVTGWPLQWQLADHIMGSFVNAHMMVEGRTLFKNVAKPFPVGSQNADWNWVPTDKLDNVQLVRDRYSYKWAVPINSGSSPGLDPRMAVIQTEGYGESTNTFTPCPSVTRPENFHLSCSSCTGLQVFDCQGHTLCYATPNLGDHCRHAAEKLDPRQTYQANVPLSPSGGTCFTAGAGAGCKIFIQGKDPAGNDCKFTGKQMREAYEYLIKENTGVCAPGVCGTKHFDNRCMVTVDYTFKCA